MWGQQSSPLNSDFWSTIYYLWKSLVVKQQPGGKKATPPDGQMDPGLFIIWSQSGIQVIYLISLVWSQDLSNRYSVVFYWSLIQPDRRGEANSFPCGLWGGTSEVEDISAQDAKWWWSVFLSHSIWTYSFRAETWSTNVRKRTRIKLCEWLNELERKCELQPKCCR